MAARADRMRELIRTAPLAHPGTFALAYRDYDHAPPDHLRSIYGQVWEGLERDGIKRLCHLKPREHGKSEAGTVDNVAWRALSDPSSRSLIMSEGSKLAEKKLEQVRTVVEEFGPGHGVEVVSSNNSELRLANDANHGDATVEASGFGSSVTGGHFDLIVFDDLVDWPSQRTEARREKIWSQFQNYLNLGSEGETVYLVLGTRKHESDLYSNLIASGAWYVVQDRAIQDWSIVEDRDYTLVTKNPETGEVSRYPADEAHRIGSDEAIWDAEPHRDVGVLWPERWPLNKLLVDLHSGYGQNRGNLVWKRENQNDASALSGQVLGEDMLVFTGDEDCRVDWPGPTHPDLVWHAGLDPAVEADPEKAASNDTDYWALAHMAHWPEEDVTFLVRIDRRRGMTLAGGLDWAQGRLSRTGDASSLLVEDQQAQRWFVQEARDRDVRVRGTSSEGKKEDRIINVASRFESGRIVMVGEPAGWSSFLSEWAAFPTGDHDDRLDAAEICYRGVGSGSTISRGEHGMGDLPL